MATFLFTYTGGSMGTSEDEMQKSMEKWTRWFASLGDAVVDLGAPLGASSTLAPDGSVREGTSAMLGGYSLVSAESIADALKKAEGCPVLATGGSVEVYETMPLA